jgi:hypothetical protein
MALGDNPGLVKSDLPDQVNVSQGYCSEVCRWSISNMPFELSSVVTCGEILRRVDVSMARKYPPSDSNVARLRKEGASIAALNAMSCRAIASFIKCALTVLNLDSLWRLHTGRRRAWVVSSRGVAEPA